MKRLVMDPNRGPCDMRDFNNLATAVRQRTGRSSMVKSKRRTHPGCQSPLGASVKMFAFVDSDHAGNVVTRRSHSGYFVFIQNALM